MAGPHQEENLRVFAFFFFQARQAPTFHAQTPNRFHLQGKLRLRQQVLPESSLQQQKAELRPSTSSFSMGRSRRASAGAGTQPCPWLVTMHTSSFPRDPSGDRDPPAGGLRSHHGVQELDHVPGIPGCQAAGRRMGTAGGGVPSTGDIPPGRGGRGQALMEGFLLNKETILEMFSLNKGGIQLFRAQSILLKMLPG